MNKDQALGQLRAVLTALGTVLTTWGLTDGHDWAPIIGVIVVLFSLTWGFLHHKSPGTSGTVSWSLVRKAVNIIGSALVTYNVVSGERVAGIENLVAALGPIIAASFSWVSNSDGESKPPTGLPMFLLLLFIICLPSCGPMTIRFTPDRCGLMGQQVEGYDGMVWVGICNDDRMVVEWDATQLDGTKLTIRATRAKNGETSIQYKTDGGWVEWSSKSGVTIGPIPVLESEEAP